MADHDLGLASATRRTLAGFCKLPKSHLAEFAFRFIGVLGGRSEQPPDAFT